MIQGVPDDQRAGQRGAVDRVAVVRRQARQTLAIAVVFAIGAPVVALFHHDTGTWLPLHVFLVGGVLAAISGAAPMLAVTWSASPAPSAVLAGVQRWVLACGAVAITVGRETGHTPLVAFGGTAVMVALVLLGVILLTIRRHVTTTRYMPAIDAYLVAVVLGIGGSALGAALATGHSDSHYEMVRNIHLTTNLYGLVGLVIAGTLPYFVATQARLKTSTRATPRNVRLIVGWLAAMVVVAVVGFWSSHPAVAGAGLLGYAAGVLAVATILPRVRRRQVRWAGPRLLQIGAGMVWWVLATVVYAAGVIGGATDRWSALRALAIGGFGQIVVGSFAYLAPVLRAGGHERLTAGFRVTRSWAGLVAANVAAAGALAGSGWLMAAGLAVWALDGAARLVWFVMQTRVG